MTGIIVKFFGFALLAIIIVYTAASAFRRSRKLDARIRAFREEQEELARQGKAQDPYGGLAEIYAEHESHRNKPRRR